MVKAQRVKDALTAVYLEGRELVKLTNGNLKTLSP
jgi:hypothetical protein